MQSDNQASCAKVSYSKWLRNTLIASFSAGVLLVVTINIIIDPCMENNIISHALNKRKFSCTKVTAKILYDHLRDGRYILIFGTSKSASITKKVIGKDVLNFSTSLYGSPADVLDFLKQLDDVQMKNIEKIYYLIDIHTFSNLRLDDQKISFNSKTSCFLASIKTLTFNKISAAYTTIYLNLFPGKQTFYMTDYGYKATVNNTPEEVYRPLNESANMQMLTNLQKFHTPTVNLLKEIDAFVKDHAIEIVYFTTPLFAGDICRHEITLINAQRNEFMKNIDGFYDFLYVPEFSNEAKNFTTDGMHVNTNVLSWLMKKIDEKDKRFYITKENFKNHMENLNSSIRELKCPFSERSRAFQ